MQVTFLGFLIWNSQESSLLSLRIMDSLISLSRQEVTGPEKNCHAMPQPGLKQASSQHVFCATLMLPGNLLPLSPLLAFCSQGSSLGDTILPPWKLFYQHETNSRHTPKYKEHERNVSRRVKVLEIEPQAGPDLSLPRAEKAGPPLFRLCVVSVARLDYSPQNAFLVCFQ